MLEKFNTNEFLRYLNIGVFFVSINFFFIQENILTSKLNIIGKESFATILIGLSLISGTTIYILYRAVIYSALINPFITFITQKKRIKAISESTKTSDAIFKMDIVRWKIKDENIHKRLDEWASQIHFLYSLSICCLIVFLYSKIHQQYYNDTTSLIYWWLTILLITVYHHVRYKLFEIEIIKSNIETI